MTVAVSIIIPVRDEAVTVAEVVAAVQSVCDSAFGPAWEAIVIDDGSLDGSAAIVAGLDGPRIRTARTDGRRGCGFARRLGGSLARGDRIAWIDADSTYVAADLVAVVGALDDADQAIGWRPGDPGVVGALRHLVKRVIAASASRLWRTPIRDLNSGLRAFRRDALSPLLPDLPDGFSCCTTATLGALNRRQRVVFVPVGYRPRPRDSWSKFRPLRDTAKLLSVVWCQWRAKPRW